MVIKSNMNRKNMIWRKEQLEELYFSKNVPNGHTHASGSGDGSSLHGCSCCRLCGSDRSLRPMRETCLWEGVEERFDHVLYDCFGVTVTPEDCKICVRCVNQLMITHKFRGLVQAAFTSCSNAVSGTSCTSGEARQEETPGDMIDSFSGIKTQDTSDQLINKKILDILNQKMNHPPKRNKRNVMKINCVPKKMIVSCSICGQKYPLMIAGDVKEFVCSRCKLKRNPTELRKWNVVLKKDDTVKADCRLKSRLRQLKKPVQIKSMDSSPKSFLKQIKAANTIKPISKSNKKL